MLAKVNNYSINLKQLQFDIAVDFLSSVWKKAGIENINICSFHSTLGQFFTARDFFKVPVLKRGAILFPYVRSWSTQRQSCDRVREYFHMSRNTVHQVLCWKKNQADISAGCFEIFSWKSRKEGISPLLWIHQYCKQCCRKTKSNSLPFHDKT